MIPAPYPDAPGAGSMVSMPAMKRGGEDHVQPDRGQHQRPEGNPGLLGFHRRREAEVSGYHG